LQIVNTTVTGGSSNGNAQNSLTRLSKIDFPRFDGDDVQGWVYRSEQFFEIDNTLDNLKVKLAAIHFSGKALLCHQSFVKSHNEWLEWRYYKIATMARFGVGAFDDPLADLMKLRQRGTVEHYQEEFDALLNRVDLPVNHAISCFLSGLNDEIQTSVRKFKPQTLHNAYCLAKLQEATLASVARRTKPILDRPPPFGKTTSTYSRPGSFSNLNSFKARPSLSGSRATSVRSSVSVSSKPKKNGRILSPKEIEEKRAKNICFFCDEKYFPSHKCTAQVYRL